MVEEDKLLEGLYPHHLELYLPTVPWSAVFGKEYTKMIGLEKIKSAPYFSTDQLTVESIYCQTTSNIMDCVNNFQEFQTNRMLIKKSLGMQYFFDPNNPKKNKTTPTFNT